MVPIVNVFQWKEEKELPIFFQFQSMVRMFFCLFVLNVLKAFFTSIINTQSNNTILISVRSKTSQKIAADFGSEKIKS